MEKKILSTFLYNHKLKFNEIEKQVKVRSNKLTYHLNKLIDKSILEKDENFYKLSNDAEELIPYLTEKKAVLPVILIALNKRKEFFLINRDKRPYKDKLSLPGGRMIMGESIKETTKRIMNEKFNIKCTLKKINSISLEHVKKNNKIIHSFLLIFVTATTNNKINYTNVERNKIISSDLKLIENHLNKKVKIENIISKI